MVAPAGAFCTVKVARSPPDRVACEAVSVTGVWQNARAAKEKQRQNCVITRPAGGSHIDGFRHFVAAAEHLLAMSPKPCRLLIQVPSSNAGVFTLFSCIDAF